MNRASQNNFSRLLFFFFFIGSCFVAKGQWTWMHGDSIPNQKGTYGVKGVPSFSNTPGARWGSGKWIDIEGDFWVYGGFAYDVKGDVSLINDLWKYDLISNQWTWKAGDSIVAKPANYGVKGLSAATNDPGFRMAVTTWTDTYGRLWLFGGTVDPPNVQWNDLWYFDPSANQWTWMGGESSLNAKGIYGNKGVSSVGNMPGARYGTAGVWKDKDGYLWMLGGVGRDAMGNLGRLNDLWKYDPNLASPTYNHWTWEGGDSLINPKAIYGIKGTPSVNNKPGGVGWSTSSTWLDGAGNFWLLDSRIKNMLWKFNPVTLEWAWMTGDTSNQNMDGFFGTRCQFDSSNHPPARFGAMSWVYQYKGGEIFYLYGGGTRNDLWAYCPYKNQWAWVSGDNTLGYGYGYGTKGLSSSLNILPPRDGACSFNNGEELWVFGGLQLNGTGSDFLNDLWRFIPDTTCVNCSDATIHEKEVMIPNVFTPNNDGINETFEITAQGYKEYMLKIYSRWGQLVFVSNHANNQWDGMIQNTPQNAPEATYYYVLELTNATDKVNTYKGFFTLIR